MTIHPSKCIFGAEDVEFLGHQLYQCLIGLREDNVKKIKSAKGRVPLRALLVITDKLFQILQ